MIHKKHKTEDKHPKEPDLMVQIAEPSVLRRDILEGLREIIIFMQGYERFKKLQDEKMKTYADLRDDLRQINSLINNHLSRYVPRGKLRGLVQAVPKQEQVIATAESKVEPRTKIPEPVVITEDDPFTHLEGQLKDIERELQNMH